MSAPLTPVGLATLIGVTWAVIGGLAVLAMCRAAADADRADKAAAQQRAEQAQVDAEFANITRQFTDPT